MAYSHSLCYFSLPISQFQGSLQRSDTRRCFDGRLLITSSERRHRNSGGRGVLQNRSGHWSFYSTSKKCYKPIIGHFVATAVLISGYWVGPDADDGWGFVEAFVHQVIC